MLQLPFIEIYPTVRITSDAATQQYPGGKDGALFTSSNEHGGGGSSCGFRARRHCY